MKKLLFSFIITSLLLSTQPMHAQPKEETKPTLIQRGKEYAMHQFNESIERLRRCVIERSCSRWDALKIGRDLLILIGTVYGISQIGRPIREGDTVSLKNGYSRLYEVVSRTPFTAEIKDKDGKIQTVSINKLILVEKRGSLPVEEHFIPPLKEGTVVYSDDGTEWRIIKSNDIFTLASQKRTLENISPSFTWDEKQAKWIVALPEFVSKGRPALPAEWVETEEKIERKSTTPPFEKGEKVVYIGEDPKYKQHQDTTFTIFQTNMPNPEDIAIKSDRNQIIIVPKSDVIKME